MKNIANGVWCSGTGVRDLQCAIAHYSSESTLSFKQFQLSLISSVERVDTAVVGIPEPGESIIKSLTSQCLPTSLSINARIYGNDQAILLHRFKFIKSFH